MTYELKRRIQIVLAAAIVIAAGRAAYIFYQRHQENIAEKKKNAPVALNADYYVTPKKLYPYDLKSARELMKQPVWVKVGYGNVCYPYNPASHHADFSHEAGTLLPIERLEITDVVLDTSPKAPGAQQVMAAFKRDGRYYAFSIGSVEGGDYHIYSDEMLFIEDPHVLYKHWPEPVWNAIDQHQVIQGMNELQASFAVGVGYPEGSAPMGDRTLKYPNGGNPLVVTFVSDKATQISNGS